MIEIDCGGALSQTSAAANCTVALRGIDKTHDGVWISPRGETDYKIARFMQAPVHWIKYWLRI